MHAMKKSISHIWRDGIAQQSLQKLPRLLTAPLKLLLLTLSLAASASAMAQSNKIDQTMGQFTFDQWKGEAINIHYALPAAAETLAKETPILFVMTGRKRNASDYRDQWQALAEQYGFIVLAPQFKWKDYPDEVSYDMGGVFSFNDRLSVPKLKDMQFNKESQWAFSAIEPIFDEVISQLSLSIESYSLYGHSSGAGFVHRYLYYKPSARVAHAVAANGAWYLLPVSDFKYPYGLKGSKITRQMLHKAFRRDFTIMFGQTDLGPRKQYHANTQQAMAQGPHVVSRAMNFLLMSLLTANQLDTPINWKMHSVPNVGHSNSKMAPWAVEFLFPERYLARAAQNKPELTK